MPLGLAVGGLVPDGWKSSSERRVQDGVRANVNHHGGGHNQSCVHDYESSRVLHPLPS